MDIDLMQVSQTLTSMTTRGSLEVWQILVIHTSNATDAGNYSGDRIEYDILRFYSHNKPQKAEFTK